MCSHCWPCRRSWVTWVCSCRCSWASWCGCGPWRTSAWPCLPEPHPGRRSSSSRLTAKLIANPPTTGVQGGPRWTAIPVLTSTDRLDGDHPTNLRVRGSSKFPWRGVRPNCQLASCSRRHQARLAAAKGARWLASWCAPMAAGRATVSRWESQVAAFECGSWPAVWMARRTTCSRSTGSLPQRQEVCQQADPTDEGGEVPADSPVLADTATLDPVEVGWLAVN
jgi:hypothetical protein